MEIKSIPLSQISPSAMNPRKTFDEGELKELADNIEKQGLLQPITVRPVLNPLAERRYDKPDRFEIVCGERRYRASVILNDKWKDIDSVAPGNRFGSISAIVREMTDDEAFDAMITENLQRKDVDPMEEAFAFGQLIEKGKTAEEIAARFGKSVRFVQDRVKLNKLIPQFVTMVREDRLPLVSAIIFSKLKEQDQLKLFDRVGQRNTVTKTDAQDEVNLLFMTLDSSVWVKHGEPDFEGSCGRSCAKCLYNTANHGCLFYEMKSESGANCTDRVKFQNKTISFILDYIKGQNLLPLGAELDGRRVVLIEQSIYYESDEARQMKEQYRKAIETAGYAVLGSDSFSHKCWYDAVDERISELLQEGRIYPVLTVFDYNLPSLKNQFYYVEKREETEGTTRPRVPTEVTNLCTQYRIEKAHEGFAADKAKAIVGNAKPDDCELNPIEREFITLLLVNNNPAIRKVAGLPEFGNRNDDYEKIKEDPWLFNKVLRAFAVSKLKNTEDIVQTEALLDNIGVTWCRDKFAEALNKARKKHERKLAEIEKKLEELGYDTDANKISFGKEDVEDIPLDVTHPLFEQYSRMRQQHPDSILLFRMGDFYETFGEDAEFCSEKLQLTLSTRNGHKIAGFPHHELDTLLPKIVRAGRKVSICEQLENPV